MTYDARERSPDQGRPVELYTFNRSYMGWYFTSADRDQVVETQRFLATPISRSNIEQGSEMNRSGLKLRVPADFPIAQLFRVAPPTDVITMTLRRFHAGDGELAVLWTGRVVNVKWDADLTAANIELEPVYTSLRRTGLRMCYGRQCPHVLYSPTGCRVNAEAFRVDGTVANVAGNVLTAAAWAAKPVGHFDGGYIAWDVAPGIEERRWVVAHQDGDLTLASSAAGVEVGAVVRAYPGCDHTLGAGGCQKFGNVVNYGGTPFIPTKNPFIGDPIY